MMEPQTGSDLISCILNWPSLRYKRSSIDKRRQYDAIAAEISEKCPLVSKIYSIKIRHFGNFNAEYLINYDR